MARPDIARRLLLWLLMAMTFTAVMIQWSRQYGRLAVPPTYDDVGYFIDAARRLDAFYRAGPVALAKGFLDNPPHSPFSTAMAMAGFALLGMSEWAPYVMNVLVVLALLLYVDIASSPAPAWIRATLAVMALTLQFAAACVLDCRPDLMAAVLTAAACVATLTWPLDRWRAALLGLLFGLAALVKPSASFLPLGLMILAAGLRVLVESRPQRWMPRADALRPLAPVVVVAAIVAAPYLLLTAPHYIRHFRYAIFAKDKPIASLPGGIGAHLRYYVDGDGGSFMLGSALPLLALAAALVALDAFSRTRRWAAFGLFVLTGAAWAVPTVSPVKQPFFGLTFDFLLLGLALRGLVGLGWPLERPPLTRRVVAAVIVVVAAVAARRMEPPHGPHQGALGDPLTVQRRGFADQIYDAIAEGDGPRRVVFTFGTMFSGDTITFWALARGRPDIDVVNMMSTDDLAQFDREFGSADLVVAAEPSVMDMFPTLPSTAIQPALLERLRSRKDFSCVRRIATPTGASAFVFERRGPFKGWTALGGLLAREGPFPQWGLGHVHWALAPAAAIELRAGAAGPHVLSIVGQAPLNDQSMEVALDGKAIARQDFGPAGHVVHLRLPVDVGAGAHRLQLAFSGWDPGPQRRAVLLTELRFDADAVDACATTASMDEKAPASR